MGATSRENTGDDATSRVNTGAAFALCASAPKAVDCRAAAIPGMTTMAASAAQPTSRCLVQTIVGASSGQDPTSPEASSGKQCSPVSNWGIVRLTETGVNALIDQNCLYRQFPGISGGRVGI